MRFSELSAAFELLEKTASRLKLTEQLARIFRDVSEKDVKHVTYLCQGILVPESEGIQLGVGDKLAEQAISLVSGKSIREIEEIYRKEGDLGLAAEKILAKKTQRTLLKEELTTKKVYDNFLKIATSGGAGSQELKVKLLSEVLSNSEPAEAKHIVRFAQGSLRLGVGDSTILDALALYWIGKGVEGSSRLKAGGVEVPIVNQAIIFSSPSEKGKKGEPSSIAFECGGKLQFLLEQKKGTEVEMSGGKSALKGQLISGKKISATAFLIALQILDEKRAYREAFERAYSMRSDLAVVSEMVLSGRADALGGMSPQLFSPIRPALAERLLTPEQIIEKIGKCSVEGKYDGFRLQVHKKGQQVKIFSRKEEPMTHMFPDIVEAVRREFLARDAIFEGEAIAFDERSSRFLPFQVTIQRKRKHGIGEKAQEIPLKLFAFELLYADGKDFTRESYETRRRELGNFIGRGARTLMLAERAIAETPRQLQEFFGKCLQEGLEGVIAKDLKAPYVAGARKFAWIKLKRSYGKSVDTFDVVIIGYYLGKGKRAQFEFGGVLTAVYDPDSRRFRSIAKVGTGFSEEQMQQFSEMLEKISAKEKPPSVESDMAPDVWVQPRIVIEVNADEITRSPSHTAGRPEGGGEGFALRFPRMISIRKDKRPEDATTESEIFEMFELQQQK